MATRDTAFETVGVLQDRIGFVEPLSERPMEKRELVKKLDVSRSTVDRATRELENAGLVNYSDGCFELTSLGQTATAEFADVVDSIQLRQWLEPFLKWVPDSEFDAEIGWFREAELLVPEPGDPYSMINRHVEAMKDLEDGWFLLPFTGLHAAEAGHESIVEGGGSAELVVGPSVAETFQSNPEYVSVLEEAAATGRMTIFASDKKAPFALNKINDRLQIISSEGDEPRALIETENDHVIEWAERVYKGYKQGSEQIIP